MIINTNQNADTLSGSVLAMLEGDFITRNVKRKFKRPLSVFSGNRRNPNPGFVSSGADNPAFQAFIKRGMKETDKMQRFMAKYPELQEYEGEMPPEYKVLYNQFLGASSTAKATVSTSPGSKSAGSASSGTRSSGAGSRGSVSVTIVPMPGNPSKLSVVAIPRETPLRNISPVSNQDSPGNIIPVSNQDSPGNIIPVSNQDSPGTPLEISRVINITSDSDNVYPGKFESGSRFIDVKDFVYGAVSKHGGGGGAVPIRTPNEGSPSGYHYGGGGGGASFYETSPVLDIYPSKKVMSKYFSSKNIRKIPLKRVLSFNELQAVRGYLQGILIDNELLGANEVYAMNDAELLGFLKSLWKGIKKVGSGIWKGVKSAGKWIGKTAGKIGKGVWNVAKKVGKGVWNVAKKVGTGLFSAAKWVGKNLWKGVKKLGSGVLSVGSFVFKNALPILKGVVSMFPGGASIALLLDALTGTGQPQEEMPQEQYYPEQQEQYYPQQEQYIPQEQYYPQQEQYIPQEQYYPQQEQYIPQEQYYPQQEQYVPQEQYFEQEPEQYAQFEEVPQEQYYPEQQEQYTQEEITEPEIYVDESGNYFDANGNQIYVDENGEMYYMDNNLSGENVFKKIGTFIQTKIIKPITTTLKDPHKTQSILERLNTLNQARTETESKLNQSDINAKLKIDSWREQAKVESTGSSFMQSYGIWLVVGAAALMLIIANRN